MILSKPDFQNKICSICLRKMWIFLLYIFSAFAFCIWQLLCLIGEAFDDESDEVNGAVVNIRNKGDKLGLWTGDASKNDATLKIGSVFNYILNLFLAFSVF